MNINTKRVVIVLLFVVLLGGLVVRQQLKSNHNGANWFGAQHFFPDEKERAEKILDQAFLLKKQGKTDEALALYDKVISEFKTDGPAASPVALAMFRKGEVQSEIKRIPEALETYNALIQTFSESNNQYRKTIVMDAYNKKAVVLYRKDKYEQALMTSNNMLKKFAEETSDKMQRPIALAMTLKCSVLIELKQYKEAERNCDETIARFTKNKQPDVQHAVAMAIDEKGLLMLKQNRPEEALPFFEQVLTLSKGRQKSYQQVLEVFALLHKAQTLAELGRTQEALPLFDQTIDSLRNNSKPELKKILPMAINAKGFSLILLSKQQWTNTVVHTDYLNRSKVLFQEVLNTKSEDLEELAFAQGMLIYIDFLLGNETQTEHKIKQLFLSENIKRNKLIVDQSDAYWHWLPEKDGAFTVLAERAWAQAQEEKKKQ